MVIFPLNVRSGSPKASAGLRRVLIDSFALELDLLTWAHSDCVIWLKSGDVISTSEDIDFKKLGMTTGYVAGC